MYLQPASLLVLLRAVDYLALYIDDNKQYSLQKSCYCPTINTNLDGKLWVGPQIRCKENMLTEKTPFNEVFEYFVYAITSMSYHTKYQLQFSKISLVPP